MNWSHCRLLLSLLTALLHLRNTHCGYDAIRTDATNIAYSDANGVVFPDFSVTASPSSPCTLTSDVSYFISELNFEASAGNILIGAANKLYLLSNNLVCLDELVWDAAQANTDQCSTVNSADQTRTCQNHIRLYKAIPMETNLVLVCGTEASISPPQCRTIDVSSNMLTAVQGPVNAANAIVSYYPEFEGFGEFIRNDTTAYFGVGFYQGNRGVGRDYQMAFYNVQSPSNGPLSVVTDITTRIDESWLKSPVTFVDYYRADYLPPTVEALSVSGGTPRPEDYHFYFVFIRENTAAAASGTEVIHSQVVRICRNDPGVNGFFSTYMKARIYCMIQVPPGREFIGANDYIYNNIDSVAFNEGGRHGEGETWQKTMYGAFSGPLIGPEGSAVCVYPAENSRETDAMASFNQGIFDIFREDLLTTDGVEKQNVYVECDPAGRIEAASLYVDIIHDIEQMGNNPLLLLEGITVTKMVVDSVCVVRSSDSTQCVNQDVLILGTDDMKVMKVVFATVTAGQTTPVYSEIISLGSGDSSEKIQALRIEEVGSEKKIFVSTISEVYQLPIERCSRFTNCSTCVGARDPHCVWHAGNNACERNPLSAVGSATGTVPLDIWQDIHDGIAPNCTNTPSCSVTATPLTSPEFQCTVQCNSLVTSVTFSSSNKNLSIADCMSGQTLSDEQTLAGEPACARFSGGLGLQNYECIINGTITGGGASGPNAIFKGFITTGVGLPAPVNTSEISAVATQNSVTVCLQLNTFTDLFRNYRFSVSYGTTVSLGSTSNEMNLTTDNCLDVLGQTPGSTFYYRVNVINSEGSAVSSIRDILLLEAVPGVISGLMGTLITSDSVMLSWSPPTETNGVISGYAINVNGLKERSCVFQTSTTYTVDGLIPYTEYSFTVEACTGAGEGPPSTALVVRTLCEPPGSVDNHSFSSSSPSMLTFNWDAPQLPNGDPNNLQYQVVVDCYIPTNSQNTGPTTNTTTTTTSHTVTSLPPLTTCCATIRARHVGGASCTDTTLGFGTEVCGQTTDTTPLTVQSLAIKAVSSSTLYVTWEEPSNYERPGLVYNVAWSPNDGSGIVNQKTVFSITGLQPSIVYTVTVSATAPSGAVGGAMSLSRPTLSLPPGPPTDPMLVVSNNDVIFSWMAPDPSVTSYLARLRCNDMDFTGNITAPATSFTFNTSSAPGTTWCAAMVQAVNSVASSEFSPRVSIVRPAIVPTKPRCFFTGNTGSNASISFTVTYPFTLTGLQVEYTVVSSTGMPTSDSQDFTIDSPNIVYVTVERDASYEFMLRFCNGNQCGEYCDVISFNTETTTPSPPETITPTNMDCCSAAIQWTLPPNEVEGSVSYTLQITSSCPNIQENNVFSDIRARSYVFTNLCAESQYAVAIRVTELTTNTTGVYGVPFVFNTISGVPTEPRSLKPIINTNLAGVMEMTINWGPPEEPNGKLTQYEIHWSPSPANTVCSDPNIKSAIRVFVDSSMTQYKTSNLSNLDLEDSKTVLVCVRALTSMQAGAWATFFTTDGATLGLQNGNGGNIETCSNLIIVAVIASLAVLTSIILGVVFVLVICYNGWTPLKEYKDKREENRVEDFSKDKKPPYNKTFSMQSTSSQAPMLRNGSTSS